MRAGTRESESTKFPFVLPKAITPRVAYRLGGEGTPSVGALIKGLDSTQGLANPPDVAVAAGPTAIVEMANTVYAIWNRSGQLLDSGQLDDFFSSSGVDRHGDEVTDPRVLYDAASGRWFSALFDVTRGEALVGVSDTSDPTGGWGLVPQAFTADVGGTCPDQPRLGLSDAVVVVGVDLFTNCEDGALKGGVVIVFDKPEMLAGASVSVSAYGGQSTRLAQITPAISLSPTPADYLVSIEREHPTIADVFTVTSPDQDGIPFEQVRIARMDPPPNAPQKGAATKLNTGDDRVQNARWLNGNLVFVASDACRSGKVVAGCARIGVISTLTAKLTQQKELALGGGRHLFYPAVELDDAGNFLLAFGYSSGTEFPGIGAVTLQPNGTFSSWTVVTKGTAPHKPGASVPRYGDYFGIGRDPAVPNQVWAGAEFGNGAQRSQGWGTTVFAMSAGSSNPPPPPPPDPKPPTAKAQATRVEGGTTARLGFRIKDNSGRATVLAGVFRGTKRLKKFPSQELANGKWFFPWRAPSKPATLSFCVQATDAAGNTSKVSCAPLAVT